MATVTKKLYLLKDAKIIYPFFDDLSRSNERTFYSPRTRGIKHFPGETYDDEKLRSLDMAIRQKNVSRTTRIWIFGIHDPKIRNNLHFVKATFSDKFVKSLSELIEEPKINIQGTFVINRRQKCSGSFCIDGIHLQNSDMQQVFEENSELRNKCGYHTYPTVRFTYSVILEWEEFGIPLKPQMNAIEKMYTGMILFDYTIKTSDGEKLRCHRSVLATQSDVIHRRFESGLEDSEKEIHMDKLGKEAAKSLLAFLYNKGINLEKMDEDTILQLLETSHLYNFTELENVILHFLCGNRGGKWLSLDGAIAMYSFSKNVDSYKNLTLKLLKLMKRNLGQLQTTLTFKAWMEKEPLAAGEFLNNLKDPAGTNDDMIVE